MQYPLDDEGQARKDAWLGRFLYDPTEPQPSTRADADRVLDPMLEHLGQFWNESISPFFAELYAVSGLEPKTVELIATAALALRGWETGVRAHARLALQSGATPDEVRGAILVVLGIGGITAAASGLAWAEPVLAEAEAAAQ